ncbi:hypothetical protein DOT_6042 [Desulfosporosinus sp. OT]|nr:hypothetical protein DOT_6042 [Desulfosporosinus sp. OT]
MLLYYYPVIANGLRGWVFSNGEEGQRLAHNQLVVGQNKFDKEGKTCPVG